MTTFADKLIKTVIKPAAVFPVTLFMAVLVSPVSQASGQEAAITMPKKSAPFVVASKQEAVFTRAQAVEYALANSPLLAAARERIGAAQGALQSAGAQPPPEVNLGVSVGGTERTTVLSQTIETSGRRGPRRGVARNELTSVEREGDVTLLDLVRDVNRAYYDLAEAQQRQTLFSDVANIVQRTRDSVRKQVEVGAIPAQDLVKSETELARAEADNVRAQAETDTARVILNTLIGRNADVPLVATEPLTFMPLALDQVALVAQATSARPELAATDARIAAARENVRLQRADYKPDLSVGLLQNTTLGSRGFLNPRETGVGVGLIFPLFDTGRIRGRVRQAEAVVREQEAVRTQTRLDVLRDVGTAFARVRATEALVARYDQDILPRAQDLLNKAQFGYDRGGTTLLENLEAQRTYRNTRAEYLTILGNNARARADLDRAVGRKPSR